ncbi:MAG: hypothetical protein QM758_06075 [Armatimonas sp.]
MPTLFVHGVTVRKPRADVLAEQVQLKLIAHNFDTPFEKYFWGGSAMALRWGGDSIPGISEQERRAQIGEFDSTIPLPDLKQCLIDSPLMELNAMRETKMFAAFAPERRAMDSRQATLRAGRTPLAMELARCLGAVPELHAAVDSAFLSAIIEACFGAVEKAQATLALPDLLKTISRSLTGSIYAFLVPPTDADTTPITWTGIYVPVDDAVRAILGGQAGLFKDLIQNAGLALALPMLRGRRGRYMPPVTRFLGDVFVYLSKRDAFLEGMHAVVTRALNDTSTPLWIIAHSLGGVISYDYCVRYGIDTERLVTVGSQVGLFAEADLLASRYPDDKTAPQEDPRPLATLTADGRLKVPSTITEWINIYDLNDMLSFRCSPIFDRVQDKPVEGDSPFPESHSSYWDREQTYELILSGMAKRS